MEVGDCHHRGRCQSHSDAGITQGESRVSRGGKEVQGYHVGVDHQRFKKTVKRVCEATEKGQTDRGRKKT